IRAGSFEANEYLQAQAEAPIFVSLGANCETATQLLNNGLRCAAYPFDWLLTLDHPLFIRCLEQDFKYFMDENYLTQFISPNKPSYVLNKYYSFEFRHDWLDASVRPVSFPLLYPKIREKYQRRIHRFFDLDGQPNKVYFVRCALDPDLSGIFPTHTPHCTKIVASQAEELKNVLSKKFPNLDFQLIIINYRVTNVPPITGIDKVVEYKIRRSHRTQDCRCILRSLSLYRSKIGARRSTEKAFLDDRHPTPN